MIKFEFIVDELDAENILSCIRDAALRNDERIIDMMTSDYPEEVSKKYIAAYQRNREYLLGLIAKMKNTQI